jgi:predicted O-methyltransferase YrrM
VKAKIPEWSPPGHYYSPIVDPEQVRRQHDRLFDRVRPELPGIALHADRQAELLARLATHYAALERYFGKEGKRYVPDNEWFGRTDAAFLFLKLHEYRPRRIVEIGCGYSTALMLDLADTILPGLELTCIDPEPARVRSLLRPGDASRLSLVAEPIQQVAADAVLRLQSGDILFVDSSHVCKTGSDVNHIFFELLPLLAQGVHVHLHDVYYPFEYPEDWVYEGWAWNEAYLLRSFLMYNEVFAITLFPSMLQHLRPELFASSMPLLANKEAASIWLTRN